MNHGNLGILSFGDIEAIQPSLRLPFDTLRPLSITVGSRLYGFYHALPKGDEYLQAEVRHDLMLTPIPYRFWPRVLRVRIRLKHQPGTFAAVTKCLADLGVSILHGQAARSAHRYCTWNLIVALMDVAEEDLEYDSEDTIYKPIADSAKKINDELEQRVASGLFTEKENSRLRDPVRVWPLNALAFFHHRSQQDEYQHCLFNLECRPHGRLEAIGNEFRRIVHQSILDDELMCSEDKSMACVFAEMDTADCNLRVAVIPEKLKRNFVEVQVSYLKSGSPDSTQGYLAHLCKLLPSYYQLWNVSTYTTESEPDYEQGGKRFLVENTISKDMTLNAADAHALTLKSLIEDTPVSDSNDQWKTSARVRRVTTVGVEQMIDEQWKAEIGYKPYDLFISYASADFDDAKRIEEAAVEAGLTVFIDSARIASGDLFAEVIRKGLVDSRELCILCTPRTHESEWVMTEWGAAWAMRMTITPILSGTNGKLLDGRLRGIQSVNIDDLPSFMEEVKRRRDAILRSR